MIVLNGEPYLRYNLRALYPFAHEIIVVEGATPVAAANATRDGHSLDTTLKTLRDFKIKEDIENKLVIVTAEDAGHSNGFWPGEKDEQSQAYAQRASGDYLWQVDVDEFYRDQDMEYVLKMLQNNPDITAASFRMITFWGATNFWADGYYLREGNEIFHRLFKWGPGYRYITHRPPTVYDDRGRNLRRLRWINGYGLNRKGIRMFHYSLLFPGQVLDKARYYASADWGKYSDGILDWWKKNFSTPLCKPFQIHNVHHYPSWIRRFHGRHPKQILCMMRDITAGDLKIPTRNNEDIERLLELPAYRRICRMLELSTPFIYWVLFPIRLRHILFNILLRAAYDFETNSLSWNFNGKNIHKWPSALI